MNFFNFKFQWNDLLSLLENLPENKFLFQALLINETGKKYRVFSGPYFPGFGLNLEINSLNLRIQSKNEKIWTRKNLNSYLHHNINSYIFTVYFKLVIFHCIKPLIKTCATTVSLVFVTMSSRCCTLVILFHF